MSPHRLDRRITLLRGKRAAAFDPDQYWYESAERQRAARKVRTLLRGLQPVMLTTPRWSQALRFLEDVATDLSIGTPHVDAHVISLQAVQGKSALQAWAWVMQRLTELCGLPIDRRFAQAVSRDGFRTQFAQLLRHAQSGPARCLMLHGLEAVHLDALRDLLEVFEQHSLEARGRRRVVLLVATSVDVPSLAPNLARVVLPDYSPPEAIEAIVEILGPHPSAKLTRLVGAVGGVPAVIERLAAEGHAAFDEAAGQRDAVWRRLGPVAVEIRGAFAIVSSDDGLSNRLELLARSGAQPEATDLDPRLARAGLVRTRQQGRQRVTEIRAPVFADLATQ